MAGRQAQVDFGFGGIRGGIKDLGDLRDALTGVGDAGKRLDATYKGLKKLWEDPAKAKGGWSEAQRAQAGIIKMGAELIGQQATAAARAVTAPAISTYDQVLAKARDYRDSTQRVATATGQSFAHIGEQIMGTSKRLGLLPSQVSGYARSVRGMTGDWDSAIGSMDAFQNRALRTDRSLEELIPTAVTLAQTFGVKSTAEVNQFFGTLDRQAKNARLSAEVAEQAFASAGGMLARISAARPASLTALSTQVVGNAVASGLAPEVGVENVGAVGGFLAGKERYFERAMRAKGLLKKGEHLTKGGRYTEEGMMRALEFAQGELPKFYRTKDTEELIGRMAESGLTTPLGAAAILGVDTKKWRTESKAAKQGADTAALRGFLVSPAGRGSLAESAKDIRDVEFGLSARVPGATSTLLEQQDRALLGGGGGAGIALGAVSPVAAGAASLLREGDAKAEWYEKELDRRRRGEALTSSGTWLERQQQKILARRSTEGLENAARAARGFDDIQAYRDYRAATVAPALPGVTAGPGSSVSAESPQASVAPLDYSALATAVASALQKTLGGTILKTQSITPPSAPAGQPVNQ